MLSVTQIGEKIAIGRKLKNMSQSQLAERLAVSAQAVGKWERGESMPDIVTFQRLAEVFGVSLNYFSDGEGAVSPESEESVSDAEAFGTTRKSRWNMSGGNWTDADFSGLCGLAEKFSSSNIERCQFVASELSGLTLKANNIIGSNFNRSDLGDCKFTASNIEKTSFEGANLTGSIFGGSNFVSCDFSGANLTRAAFRHSSLQKLTLDGAIFSDTAFKFSHLIDIKFCGMIKDSAFEHCNFTRFEFNGATLLNTFIKNTKMKRVKFTDCKADKITYAFLKSAKAELGGIQIIETSSSEP